MILKYGNYAHQPAECSISITKSKTYDQTGKVTGFVERWTIDGRLEGANRTEITSKINNLETAYGANGFNLILYDIDGTTQTAHGIISSNTLFGTKILDLNYPDGQNAEYSTFRNYRITAEATYWAPPVGATDVSEYQTNLDFLGTGGPRFVIRPMLSGAPVKQQINSQTPVQCIQSGSSTGILGHPTADPPTYPADEQLDRRSIKRSFTQRGGKPRYTTTWSYTFLKTTPF